VQVVGPELYVVHIWLYDEVYNAEFEMLHHAHVSCINVQVCMIIIIGMAHVKHGGKLCKLVNLVVY